MKLLSRRRAARRLARAAASSILLVVIGSCSKEKRAEHTEPNNVAVHADAGPRTVHVPLAVLADARVKTMVVDRESLLATVDLPGEIASDPDKTSRLASPVAGRIEQVAFREGSTVKRGDVLARVRVPELGRIRSALAATDVRAKAARADADRLGRLADQGLATRQDAVNADAQARALMAEASALDEQLRALGSPTASGGALLALRAQVDGVVVERAAVVGQPVNPDQTIATIADLREVWFLARAYERDLAHLRVGARATVALNAVPSRTFDGSVTFIAKQADPATRTITARIPLTNDADALRIGLFGTAHVQGDTADARAATVVVLRKALTEVEGVRTVFVRRGVEDFELRPVRVGDGTPDRVEIVEGLAGGEEVVVEGTFALKSVALKAALAEEP